MIGDLADHLARPFVPSQHVVDHQHARIGARPQWSCRVGVDDLIFVTMDAHGFRNYAFVNHGNILPQSNFVGT